MKRSIEITGKTQDEALAAALKQLGKERDEVTWEVLERPKSGFLGIGSVPAKIRVSFEERDSRVADAERFLEGLFRHMDVEATITSEFNEEENLITMELSGDHVGALIGRRGETLDAIQHLTNYVINNGSEDRTRVNIDAENYRAKRADALTRLAEKVAAKVVRYRRSVTLEPMNAYERHVIHTALQDYENVTTYSTGTEPNRRVVVSYERPGGDAAPQEKTRQQRPPRERRDRDREPRQRRERPAKADFTKTDYAAPPVESPTESTAREWH